MAQIPHVFHPGKKIGIQSWLIFCLEDLPFPKAKCGWLYFFPFLIGDTSSTCCFSILMLVFVGVYPYSYRYPIGILYQSFQSKFQDWLLPIGGLQQRES